VSAGMVLGGHGRSSAVRKVLHDAHTAVACSGRKRTPEDIPMYAVSTRSRTAKLT
jgi:hypothetical protein